jgi:3',5'-cyclic AMP phosphodiesterase CpdA
MPASGVLHFAMPITLPPISRRGFLKGVLATGAAALLPRDLWGASQSPLDVNRLALLSDIHIHANRAEICRNANMFECFAASSKKILALDALPANVLINGDCAFRSGEPNDYATLIEALTPLREGGLPVHLGLGNHDHRANLTAACGVADHRIPALRDHRVMLLPLPTADWYILDSLKVTHTTPGTLGPDQLAWLKRSLDARSNRPAVIMLHHQPQNHANEKITGLTDTAELLAIVLPRRQVKAVLFGHTHVWENYTRDGLHFINLPSNAYAFREGPPTGWVDAQLTPRGMFLQLHTQTAKHPQNKQLIEFPWR